MLYPDVIISGYDLTVLCCDLTVWFQSMLPDWWVQTFTSSFFWFVC